MTEMFVYLYTNFLFTGLPIEIPNRGNQENVPSPEKAKETANIIEKIKDLSNQLLERWSSLKVRIQHQ